MLRFWAADERHAHSGISPLCCTGHTNLGWSEALVLAEVAPECQDEILRCGYEYGYNRLIVGYHWFTDIEASRQLAALVARLHADPQFLDLLAAARAAGQP